MFVKLKLALLGAADSVREESFQDKLVAEEAAKLKRALLGAAALVRAESFQDELVIGESCPQGHQMSELAQIQSPIQSGVSPKFNRGIAGVSPACIRAPPGLDPPQKGVVRRMSEHAKVHASYPSSEFFKQRAFNKLGKLAAESSDSGDDSSASLSTRCGDDSYSEPPSHRTSPKLTSQSDPVLPCGVRRSALSHIAVGAGSPVQMGASSLAVIVRGSPRACAENLFLEELRDAGFIRNRDFDHFEFNSKDGSSYVSFVNEWVMRSFVAAFDGRKMQHASDCEFVVVLPL